MILKNYVKNLVGWRSNRRLIVFAIDDYGNVRLASKEARQRLDRAGYMAQVRFDEFDSMETREDLESLFDVLTSVKDKNGDWVTITPYALPCNINFEAMREEGYARYIYELLPETFRKLAEQDTRAYQGVWPLWQEGISKGLLAPEFHGREHFNLKIFNEKLTSRDGSLIASLENRSLTSISDSGYRSIGWPAAFAFWDPDRDTKEFPSVMESGLKAFYDIFGFRSTCFTPPVHQLPLSFEEALPGYGIETLDKPFFQRRHLGKGRYKSEFAFSGFKGWRKVNHMVRNVIFEPTNSGLDWVARAMSEIESAFALSRPAVVSSHRVNYSGYISEANRKTGLGSLKALVTSIARKWPDVEFVSAATLGKLMKS